MLNRRRGIVQAVQGITDQTQELVIKIDGELVPSVNYRVLAEDVYPGDLVEINTTAVDLGLGLDRSKDVGRHEMPWGRLGNKILVIS